MPYWQQHHFHIWHLLQAHTMGHIHTYVPCGREMCGVNVIVCKFLFYFYSNHDLHYMYMDSNIWSLPISAFCELQLIDFCFQIIITVFCYHYAVAVAAINYLMQSLAASNTCCKDLPQCHNLWHGNRQLLQCCGKAVAKLWQHLLQCYCHMQQCHCCQPCIKCSSVCLCCLALHCCHQPCVAVLCAPAMGITRTKGI